ncbi:hypothetical protein HYX02_07985 [Candidatus Woesearchaeota archaeon]|nr:hypothetical protein [Candidatus Woesearchaeota archaeon]
MTLDMLLGEESRIPPQTLYIKGRQASFLFGVKRLSKKDNHPKTIFELLYETELNGMNDIEIIKILEKVGYEDQDLNSGTLYAVETYALEVLSPKSITKGYRDYRYMLFGSRAIYKSFFNILNERRINSSLGQEGFQCIYDNVGSSFKGFSDKFGSTKNESERMDIVRWAIEDFERDELIAPYIEEARLRIPSKLH